MLDDYFLRKVAEKVSGKKSHVEEYLKARKGKIPVSPPTSPSDKGSSSAYPIDPLCDVEKKASAIKLIKQALGEDPNMAPPPQMPPDQGPPPSMEPQGAPPVPPGPPPQAGGGGVDPMMAKLQQHAMEHQLMAQLGLEGGGQPMPPGPPPPMGPQGTPPPPMPPEMQKQSALRYLKEWIL